MKMLLIDYIQNARRTATYPPDLAFQYLALGLVGESGEVSDKFKKLIRDERWDYHARVPQDKVRDIALELGDTLWYVANIMWEINNGCKSAMLSQAMLSDIDYIVPSADSQDIVRTVLYLNAETSSYAFSLDGDHMPSAKPLLTILSIIRTIADALGYSMSEIAAMNTEKLLSRLERNKLSGSGDHR